MTQLQAVINAPQVFASQALGYNLKHRCLTTMQVF